MPVPKAAVYENGGVVLWQHDIWPTRQGSRVQPIPVSQSEKGFTNTEFDLSVLASN